MSEEKPFNERRRDILRTWSQQAMSFEDAKAALDTLFREAERDAQLQNQGEVCLSLGIIFGQRSAYTDSIEYFTKAKEFFLKANLPEREAWTIMNTGESYRLLGNHVRAQSYYFQASERANELGMIGLRVMALTNEGQMWLALKSLEKAENSLTKALTLDTEWQAARPGDVERENNYCELYAALVRLYLEKKAPEQAWEAAKAAYELARDSKYALRVGIAKRALAEALNGLMRQAEEAEFQQDSQLYFEEAIAAFNSVDAESEVGKTLVSQAKILAKRGQRQIASQKFQQALRIFNRLGMQADAADVVDAQLSLL